MANTVIYKEDWEVALQDNLDQPKYWQEISDVKYTDRKVTNTPYQADPTAASLTRGTAYSLADWTVTNENLDIANSYVVPEFIDRADLAQTGYDMQMERADRQAEALLNQVEIGLLAEMYANAGNTGTTVTLSATNVDDVFREARKLIVEGKGLNELNSKGAFAVLSPASYELLVSYMQTSGIGFMEADSTLTTGVVPNFNGFKVRESNLLGGSGTESVFGVNKATTTGILKSTFGQVVVDDKDPDLKSGISVVSRVDYGFLTPTSKENLLVKTDLN